MDVESLKIDRKAPSRKTRRRRNPWPLRLLALAVLGGLGWLFQTPLRDLIDRYRLPVVHVVLVTKSHPAAAGALRGTAANGHVVAARRAALSADTPGRIVAMNVKEGSLVNKGDVVAKLYADEYAAGLRRAEAELAAAKLRTRRAEAAVASARAQLVEQRKNLEATDQQVAEAHANATLAREEFDRAERLQASGVATRSALDSARAQLDATAARVRAAEALQHAAAAAVEVAQRKIEFAETDRDAVQAEVATAIAARDLAAATLDKTEVRAPFSGIVVLKDAEVGEVVSPNSQGGSNARGAVCTMVDRDSLEAQAEVPETNLAAVQIGAPATVYLDAYPGHAYACKVDRIWPTADRQKATIEVRIRFVEPDERLRPEMGLRVVFAATPDQTDQAPAILIPDTSLVEIDGQQGVFLLERDTVRFTALELGDRRAGRVVVVSGLRTSQRLVADPPLTLRSGDRVRVAE